jgi:DNA-binding PadR family transcriptional regulator
MSRPVPDAVILGLLKAQPSHGYDLLERFRSKEHLGHIWHLSTSQLYAVLKRLEEAGAIQGMEVEVPDAPARRQYHIMPMGEQQLHQWLLEKQPSASLHRIRVIFLSRLYIAWLLDYPDDGIFQNQIVACKKQLKDFCKVQNRAESEIELAALALVINQLSAVIDWLETFQIAANNDAVHLFKNLKNKVNTKEVQ